MKRRERHFKNIISLLLVFGMLLSYFTPFIRVNAETVIDEIKIESDTTAVMEGNLPEYSVRLRTNHISIEEYGSNTNWSKNNTDNKTSWFGFGNETPEAVDDGTHYALRLCINKENGYTFANNTRIIFNEEDVTESGLTYFDTGFDWGGYLYIDLGVANNTHTVTFDKKINGDESDLEEMTILHGQKIGEYLNNLNNGDLLFAGWYEDDTYTTYFDIENNPIVDDVRIYARWAEGVTVSLNVNGGNPVTNNIFVVPKGVTLEYVASLLGENPTHSDWMKTIGGITLNSENGEPVDGDYVINEDATFYLQWIDLNPVGDVNITIDAPNVGDNVAIFHNNEEDADEPTVVPYIHWDDRDDYGLFKQMWITTACAETNFECDDFFTGEIAGSTDYYALFKISAGDGYGFTHEVINNIMVNGEHPYRTKYEDNHEVYIIAKVRTENALQNPKRVSFQTDGADPIDDIVVESNTVINAPETPVKENYTFLGWYEDSELNVLHNFNNPVLYDITLFAKWRLSSNKIDSIDVNLNAPRVGDVVETQIIGDEHMGEEIQTNNPNASVSNNQNYEVVGTEWVNGTCKGESSACYERFEGTINEDTYYYANIYIEAKEGYFFDVNVLDHVTINGEAPEEIFNVYGFENTNFIAKIKSEVPTPDNHVVTFKDGEQTLFDRYITNGNKVERPEVDPHKESDGTYDYTFANWYSDSTLTTVFDFNTSITTDTTIYAKWNATVHNNKVYFMDGENIIDVINTNEGKVARPFYNPIKTNDDTNIYEFEDWYSDSTLTTKFDFNTNIDVDGTRIYAKFVKKQDVEFDVLFEGTNVNLDINNKNVMNDMNGLVNTFKGVIKECGTNDSAKTNELKFSASFGDKAIKSITINDVVYSEANNNAEISGEFWFVSVPGAEKYVIRGTADEESKVARTIIWANTDANESSEEYEEDMVLEHGSAKIVGVFDNTDKKISGENNADKDGFGYAVVEPGSKVLFEFVPEYGYQLVDVKVNGISVSAQDFANQYVFEMPDANVHFSAEFVKTEDLVKSESKTVSSGTIKLGSELEGGSAKLTIKDVELNENKIKDFEKAAGDYKISSYLDIDLYNIFYKGKNDANDVWENKITELDKEATITIKLEDGINGDDIVIVHNIHDGEEYEIIPIDSYDKETNTITFRTKSFSNYAIATKASVNTPKTIDNGNVWLNVLVVSLSGLVLSAYGLKRKERKEK